MQTGGRAFPQLAAAGPRSSGVSRPGEVHIHGAVAAAASIRKPATGAPLATAALKPRRETGNCASASTSARGFGIGIAQVIGQQGVHHHPPPGSGHGAAGISRSYLAFWRGFWGCWALSSPGGQGREHTIEGPTAGVATGACSTQISGFPPNLVGDRDVGRSAGPHPAEAHSPSSA